MMQVSDVVLDVLATKENYTDNIYYMNKDKFRLNMSYRILSSVEYS